MTDEQTKREAADRLNKAPLCRWCGNPVDDGDSMSSHVQTGCLIHWLGTGDGQPSTNPSR